MEANYTDTQSECWICPLLSFYCAPEIIDFYPRPESIELAKAIQVKRVPSEFTDYLNENHPDWIDIISSEYMVVLPRTTSVGDEIMGVLPQTREATNLLFNIVTAFRLCHAGAVSVGPLIPGIMQDSELYVFRQEHVPSAITEFFTDISKTEVEPETLEIPEYELSTSDIPVINTLIREIQNYRKSGQYTALDTALRRFNSAYYGELEDRLIDQMIAFESLYIADDKELGYKLALRTAFLLGKNRTKIFMNMKKAYELRGQIVHGNKPVDRTKLEETIPKTEEYLRRSIRRFLSLSKQYPISEIRKLLDENVLKNGKTLALKD
ncbi:MAG TPA: hypothetical protein VMW60_04420 [Dehalococcoidales bacterium]|nr:hypothetical protein [Dehalococcoidales bacterium]